MLDDLRWLAGPHCQREGVHKGLWPPLAPPRAFIIHPELGKVQRPKVSGGWGLECICACCGHQASVDIVTLGVLFVGVAQEDGVKDGQGGGRSREGSERGGKEVLLFKCVEQSLKIGAGAVGWMAGVGSHHFGGLNRDGARQIGRVGSLPISGDHQLTDDRTHRTVRVGRKARGSGSPSLPPPHLQHEAVDLDVDVLVGLLGVVQLVDFHELLQTLPEVEGEKVEPHKAARIQYELQGIQLDVEVRARD